MMMMMMMITIIITTIIIVIIIINCNWVITWWQWLFYMYTNMKKKVTRKFKLGGLHEKHYRNIITLAPRNSRVSALFCVILKIALR